MPAAPIWQCSSTTLDLSRPCIMGILNVTPDSFSDGGDHNTPEAAIAAASAMLSEGADLIDVGGESTRPGFRPVDPEEEFCRLEPVVSWLIKEGVLVSVDTRHAAVAARCIDLGAKIVNDVTGFSDPAMVAVAEGSDCGCVVMHAGPVSGAVTKDSAIQAKEGADDLAALMESASAGSRSWEEAASHPLLPEAAPLVDALEGYLLDRAHELERHGVARERICLDPGAGFGKSPEDNIVILRHTAHLADLGYPVMCAVSRKRFVGTLSGTDQAKERDEATIGVTLAAVAQGARVLRVHEVRGMAEALDGFWPVASDCTMQVDIAIDLGGCDVYEVASSIDHMPLTRLAGKPAADGHISAITALSLIPFRHALAAALAPTGAAIRTIAPLRQELH